MNIPEIPLIWREIGLGIALGAIVVLGFIIWQEREDREHHTARQIAAIQKVAEATNLEARRNCLRANAAQAYFEERFKIDAEIPGIPQKILDLRRAAIDRYEARLKAIGSCT